MVVKEDIDRVMHGHAFITEGRIRDLVWYFAKEVLFRAILIGEVCFFLWWWNLI